MVRTKRNTLLGLTLGGLLATGAMGGVLAQDAPPAGVVTHPAHVHMGSCAELDPNPKYPLTSVGPRLTEDNELPATEDVKGSLTASPVEYSETEIEANFDELLEESHAINIHESDQNVQNYIACGDIGGPVLDDKLFIGLLQLNGSGYSGVAELEKDGDDKVNIKVYLFSGGTSGTPATPTA